MIFYHEEHEELEGKAKEKSSFIHGYNHKIDSSLYLSQITHVHLL